MTARLSQLLRALFGSIQGAVAVRHLQLLGQGGDMHGADVGAAGLEAVGWELEGTGIALFRNLRYRLTYLGSA